MSKFEGRKRSILESGVYECKLLVVKKMDFDDKIAFSCEFISGGKYINTLIFDNFYNEELLDALESLGVNETIELDVEIDKYVKVSLVEDLGC